MALPHQSSRRPSPGSPTGPLALSADLDGDRRAETVVFAPRQDPAIEIRRGAKRIASGVPLRMHPWKLRIGDVIGDGTRQMVFGVHKPTRYFPKPHAGLFVFGFDGTRIVKRWLGSHLADPFVDFDLVRPTGQNRDKLVALECRRSGRLGLTVYSWVGFGFGADEQKGSWRSARIVSTGAGTITVRADGKTLTISVR